MQNFLGILIASLLLAAFAASETALAADWVNDWFDQKTTTSAGSYSTQQRGYYTAGGFDARYRMSNDYLVSAQPPSIKVGCGGIDITAGSLSYLNPQYVVQKFQNIIQAAPAFAFDLAMQEFCKPCVATMQFLDNSANLLNQLQMNDCQAAQGLAKAIVQPSSISAQLQGQSLAVQSIEQGLSENWAQFQSQVRSNGGKNPQPAAATTQVDSCPADFRNVFTGGSVVKNASGLVGMSGYAPLMRSMVGDVVVNFDTTQNLFNVSSVEACPGNDQKSGDDFLYGTASIRDASGQCVPGGFTTVIALVDAQLTGIANQIQSNAPLTVTQQAFVNSSPLPLFNILRDSVQTNTASQVISSLEITLSIGYAHRIMDDLFTITNQVLNKARELETQAGQGVITGGDAQRCDVRFLEPAFSQMEKMRNSLIHYRQLASADYAKSTQELIANLTLTRAFYDQRIKLLNDAHKPIDSQKH